MLLDVELTEKEELINKILSLEGLRQAHLVHKEYVTYKEKDLAAKIQEFEKAVSEFSRRKQEFAVFEKSLLDKEMSLRPSIEQEVRMELNKAEQDLRAQQKHLSVEIYHKEIQLEIKQKEVSQ